MVWSRLVLSKQLRTVCRVCAVSRWLFPSCSNFVDSALFGKLKCKALVAERPAWTIARWNSLLKHWVWTGGLKCSLAPSYQECSISSGGHPHEAATKANRHTSTNLELNITHSEHKVFHLRHFDGHRAVLQNLDLDLPRGPGVKHLFKVADMCMSMLLVSPQDVKAENKRNSEQKRLVRWTCKT